MNILIRDKKMPENCQECFCLNDEYFYCQAMSRKPSDDNLTNTRPDWCPLIELSPHGRLIDADELMLKIRDYIEEYSETDEHGWHNEKWCAMKEIEMAINNAPTVISAEEIC